MNSADPTPGLLGRLATLRTEPVDLAYDLDVRGSRAAADVAMTTSARLAELCAEFADGPSTADAKSNRYPCPKSTASFVE
jgi:hypothetical protein